MACFKLLRELGYEIDEKKEIPKEGSFAVDTIEVDGSYEYMRFRIRGTTDEGLWYLETKVILTDENLMKVCCLAAKFAPIGSTVYLQADTHNAGNIFVGMIMMFDDIRIPINLVSGDIGCGLTVLPVSRLESDEKKITQISIEEHKNVEEYHSYILGTIRQSLKRGKIAEEGSTLNEYVQQAAEFYDHKELPEWLNEMKYILDICGLKDYRDHIDEDLEGLSSDQSKVLRYIGKFAQSLGSSGNHFMEFSTDDRGFYWIVIHSGSRGLGAKIYEVIAQACRVVNDSYEIATGNLAVLYTRAYDALNKFAKLNRVICGISVLKALGYEHRANKMKSLMKESYLFADAIQKCGDEEAMLSLMSGLTHNGLKAFVNDETRERMFVLSKGAVAMTKRASASIVALRAGDGCYLWTLVNPECNWREVTLKEAISRSFYRDVYYSDDIIYSGHGAGRSQSATATAKLSTFEDVVAFYDEMEIVGNVAPGILGDNPRMAYNDVPTIIKHLPLDIACTKSQLKTRVTYKEGISYKRDYTKMCGIYINETWSSVSDSRKLWLDINVCQRDLKNGTFSQYTQEREVILERLKRIYSN